MDFHGLGDSEGFVGPSCVAAFVFNSVAERHSRTVFSLDE
jgi:hypothetical protein